MRVYLHAPNAKGLVVQLVRIHACHAWGRGFESRPDRKALKIKRVVLLANSCLQEVRRRTHEKLSCIGGLFCFLDRLVKIIKQLLVVQTQIS